VTTLQERIRLLACVDPEIRELLWTEDQVAACLRLGRILSEMASPEAKRIIAEIVAGSRGHG
jgi:hypothetical protein